MITPIQARTERSALREHSSAATGRPSVVIVTVAAFRFRKENLVSVNRKLALTTCAIALVAFASPALSQEAPASDRDFTVSASATVTSDYRFRGVSHSDKRIAVQEDIGIAHSLGLYAGLWGSSIDSDTPINGGADEEMNFYGGLKKTFWGVTLDGGWHYFFYPDHDSGAFARSHANILETFIAARHKFALVSAGVELDYSPKQKSLASGLRPIESTQDNIYLQGELSGTTPGIPISLSAHVGRTFGPSYLTYTEENYTDWKLTAACTWSRLTVTVGYLDTTIKNGTVKSAGAGRDLAKAGAFGALSVAF